jgi:hypothetical protein
MKCTKPRTLPEFDILVQMAKEQPDELEKLRTRLSNDVIDSAPDRIKQRLRGLQFQIDVKRKTSSNPLSACIHISTMMQESFGRMRSVLNGDDVEIQKSIRRRVHNTPSQRNNVLLFPRF